MLELKALDLPSFECLQALVDDELIYQKLKFEVSPLPSPSLSLQEKSYMTMKPSKQDNSGDSEPENYYSNKTMEKLRESKTYSGNFGPDGEPIYEDADKYISKFIATILNVCISHISHSTCNSFLCPLKHPNLYLQNTPFSRTRLRNSG